MVSKGRSGGSDVPIGSMLFFKEVRMVYKKIVKFETECRDDSTIMHLLRHDAFFTYCLYLLLKRFENTMQVLQDVEQD